MASITITYSIDLEQRGDAYYVLATVGGEQVHEVGPIGDREMAERVQDNTAARIRDLLESNKARIVRHLTATR